MPFEATLVQAPKVEVGGSSLDQFWANKLLSLSLELQFQLPARLIMRFATPVLGQSAPRFPFALDTQVKVSFPVGFSGGGTSFVAPRGKLYVTEIGAERDGADTGEYVVVAHDASFRLTRRHNVATFAEMTASEVAAKVATDGTGISRGKVDSTTSTVPYLLQSDTDFGFISTLARRSGFDWWVDDDKFHFVKRPASPTRVAVGAAENLLRFSVSHTAVASPDVKVLGWDRDNQQLVDGTARPGTLPASDLPGVQTAKQGVDRATTLTTGAVRVESQSEAEQIAQTIVDRQMSSTIEAQGESFGNPSIVPGVVVVVTGDHFGGDYHVTRVEHRYTADGYVTRFSAGDRVPSGLADMLGGSSLPEQFGSHQGLPALIPAEVTTIGTGEHLGRVKVKFPNLSNDNSSHWARVLSAGGGPERGFWFLPEVGDEVLVAFEGGDSRFPVVMGGLYGRVTTPESQLLLNGMIASRSVRSRLGHYMDFVDGNDDKTRHIALGLGSNGAAGTDYRLRIGEDRFDIEVPEGKPISIKAGAAQITFTDKKAIEITADKISIKATNELALEGKTVKVTGTQEVQVGQGGNKVTLSGSGVDVKGTPSASFKAPQVSIG